jgi:hypothetical protein
MSEWVFMLDTLEEKVFSKQVMYKEVYLDIFLLILIVLLFNWILIFWWLDRYIDMF